MNRPFGEDVLVVPNKVHLLPNIAEEAIYVALTQIVGTVQPVWAENSHLQLSGTALALGVECVEEGGAIVPLQVVENITQLVLYDVEVAAIGPVVPEVDYLEDSREVHH